MKILLILLLILIPALSSAELAEESIAVDSAEFTKNESNCDNHMYYDGTYLWLVNTEWQLAACTGTVDTYEADGQNLIKYNPSTRTYTKYTLAALGGGNQILYQVIPGLTSAHLYIYAPYGSPLGLWKIQTSDGATVESCTAGDWVNGGGGKIAVTSDGTNDIIWATNGSQRKLGKFIFDGTAQRDATFTIDTEGTYGIAATQTTTANKWNVYVAAWSGKLYIVDSSIASGDTFASFSTSIDFRTITGYTRFGLLDAYYDGKYIWITGNTVYDGSTGVDALIKYTPSPTLKGLGSYEIFYTTVVNQTAVGVKSRGRYTVISGEKMSGTASSRTLCVFDNVDEVFRYIPVTTFGTTRREMPSVEILNNGEIWLGGYGFCQINATSPIMTLTRIHETGAWMR